jgi:hypothetical protein
MAEAKMGTVGEPRVEVFPSVTKPGATSALVLRLEIAGSEVVTLRQDFM